MDKKKSRESISFFSQKSEKRRGEEGAELADVSFAANFFQLKAKKEKKVRAIMRSVCDINNMCDLTCRWI